MPMIERANQFKPKVLMDGDRIRHSFSLSTSQQTSHRLHRITGFPVV
ncbi:hypothetical protein LEP1GSC036_2652 [Leptospira weilii str. 2006001853]|uniref:Uncharacterized protein n=1 Tax=Leptospira weilii str. 2006001853 TaxID=1001589 RepID=A0A828Z3F8_9LEPT|nr:hypothetical protein LEP1GSC036_2652 [Leptospira weilii str. 2006001853]